MQSNARRAAGKAAPTTASEPGGSEGQGIDRASVWLVPVVVLAVTALAFLPALKGQFVNWDDDHNFLTNLNYRGLGWPQLRWMFTTFHLGPYQPLSWLTLGVDFRLWGLNPFGYHLTNLLLHTANAGLFYLLAVRLFSLLSVPAHARTDGLARSSESKGGFPSMLSVRVAAGVAALAFAIHPLRVESVAWVTERRDVLSGFFAILTLLAYLEAVAGPPRGRRYTRWLIASVCLFALSLLSKASAMVLPPVLLLVDVYLLRRPRSGLLIEKVPFAVLSIAAAILAAIGQARIGILATVDQQGPAARTAQGMYGLSFYLWKSLVPTRLSNLYEVPFRANPLDVHFLFAGAVVGAITIVTFFVRNRWPAVFVAWASYVLLLLPVSGIAHFGAQIVADRYSYIPCFGWALLAGGGVLLGWRSAVTGILSPGAARSLAVVMFAVLMALAWMTSVQAGTWRNSETLWSHALSLHPLGRIRPSDQAMTEPYFQDYAATLRDLGELSAYYSICNNLGVAVRQAGRAAEAIDLYTRGAAVNPSNAELQTNWGAALMEFHRYDEAAGHLQKAVQLDPESATAYFNLGLTRAAQHKIEEAIAAYTRAMKLDPQNAESPYNLGNILAEAGRYDEAVAAYRLALGIKPDHAEAYNHLALTLRASGRPQEAIDLYVRAVALDPSNADFHNNWGATLMDLRLYDQAVAHLEEATHLNPALAKAHFNLGRAHAAQRRIEEAVDSYSRAMSLDPQDADAPYSLGVILADAGRFDEAVAAYRRAVALKPNYADAYNNLGAALGHRGELTAAVDAFRRALAINPSHSGAQKNLAQAIDLLRVRR
jgi:tetratricopeptide (TPR) repeat protein